WIAAPLITIAATVAVIRLTQLKIGFERARTEIAVVEIHANYPRAHATRYLALYNSLSTRYDFTFDSLAGVGTPFASRKSLDPFDSPTQLVYATGAESASIHGFDVPSNSVGMFHTEEMLDLGGPLRFQSVGGDGAEEKFQLTNDTGHALRQVRVWRGSQWVTLGDLAPGESTKEPFSVPDPDEQQGEPDPFSGRVSSGAGSPDSSAEETDPVAAKVAAAALNGVNALRIQARPPGGSGEIVLLAWTDQLVGGLKINPAPGRTRQGVLFVAHLRQADSPSARPDLASYAQTKKDMARQNALLEIDQ
ncbi:MAG: hypothetical protein N2C14_03885, partial [Planctomycetales bacterium]